MAVWLDLLERLEDGVHQDETLHVEAYYTASLPRWLADPLRDTRHNAGAAVPVTVFNVKSYTVPDALCVVRLADFERLVMQDRKETHDYSGVHAIR